MNAVSLTAPPPIPLVVLSQASAFQTGAVAPNGFTDLINLLFAGLSPEPEGTDGSLHVASQPGSSVVLPQNSALKIAPATPDQIASAMIRFMTKAKQASIPTQVSVGKKNLPEQRIVPTQEPVMNPSQMIFIPGGLNPPSPKAAVEEVVALKVATGSNGKPGHDGSSLQTPVVKTPEAANAKSPVTFEMRLTPVVEQPTADTPTVAKPSLEVAKFSAVVIQPPTLTDPQTLPDKPSETPNVAADKPGTLIDPPLVVREPKTPAPGEPATPRQRAPMFEQRVGERASAAQPGPERSQEKDAGNTESETRQRQQQPSKLLAVDAADATTGAPQREGSALEGMFAVQAVAPVQTVHASLDPALAKNMEPSLGRAETPVSDLYLKDPSPTLPQPLQTHQIEVRIAQPETPPVDLRIAQRGQQIQVVVRTGDEGLETSLRQDLNALVHSLERSGFHAETFVPSAGSSGASGMNSQSGSRHAAPDSFRDPSSGQNKPNQGQTGQQNNGRGPGGNSRGNTLRYRQPSEAWTHIWEETS